MSAQPESPAELLLAVDAGGSKTVACLAHSTGAGPPQVLARGRAGGGNPLSVGFDQATRAVDEAVLSARRAGNLSAAPIGRAVLAVAGAANPQIADQFVRWARDAKLAARIAIVSDVLPILAAGTDATVGIALIAGTGSVAFARAADGRTIRSGGWGYLLGDDGSGYSIGRAAIRLALEDSEMGAGKVSPLAMAIMQEIRTNTAAELVRTIYAATNPRALIASLAPLVVKAAENGDVRARTILDTAAAELADLVARTASASGLAQEKFQLAAAGGVLVGSDYLRAQVAAQLAAKEIDCELRVVVDPLAGCLRLADPEFAGTLVEWH